MDQSLIRAVNVVDGLVEGGKVLVNTTKPPSSVGFEDNISVSSVDATGIAINNKLGSRAAPIVNSAILGGFVKVSGVVELESLITSIKNNVPIKEEQNAQAARDAYEQVVIT